MVDVPSRLHHTTGPTLRRERIQTYDKSTTAAAESTVQSSTHKEACFYAVHDVWTELTLRSKKPSMMAFDQQLDFQVKITASRYLQ